jgi:tetratricopeptide (TPR) repeat protein
VRLGQALEALNRLADALSSYLTSVSLDSRTFGGRLGAGRVLVQLDRPAEAVEHLQVATEVEPASGEAWSTLAVAYQETDESQDAAAAFDRAIELVSVQDAGRYDLLLAAGRAAAMIGDNGSARDRLNQARQLRPDSAEPVRLMATLQNTRAIEARQRGDEAEAVRRYEDAARLLEEAVLLDPGDARLLTTLGSIRIQLWLLGGKLDPTLKQKGLDAWQRSLELDPSQRQVEAALKRYGQQ